MNNTVKLIFTFIGFSAIITMCVVLYMANRGVRVDNNLAVSSDGNGPLIKKSVSPEQDDVAAFREITSDASKIDAQFFDEFRAAKSAESRDAAKANRAVKLQSLAERYLELASRNPVTKIEIAALLTAADKSPTSPAGREANQRLLDRVGKVEFDELAEGLNLCHISGDGVRGIAPNLLAAVHKNMDHPQAAKVLVTVCSLSKGIAKQNPSDEFASAANLIVDNFADSPDIANFCQLLGFFHGSPTWAIDYEKHLRIILEKNRDRYVRVVASLALASVVQATGSERQEEARTLYLTFLKSFDGQTEYHATAIENELINVAKRELSNIESRGLGQPAPEIDGLDLDEQPLKLSDYRGKVVLLSFWATWCGPCLKMIPHERKLIARFGAQPFVILGVNGDQNLDSARTGVKKHEISWKSFQNVRPGRSSIFKEWGCFGWPTFYLIDQDGVIRHRWIDEHSHDEIQRAVESLLAAKQQDPK